MATDAFVSNHTGTTSVPVTDNAVYSTIAELNTVAVTDNMAYAGLPYSRVNADHPGPLHNPSLNTPKGHEDIEDIYEEFDINDDDDEDDDYI